MSKKKSNQLSQETPKQPEAPALEAKEVETSEMIPGHVYVILWEPGFNGDTGKVLNKPYQFTTNVLDWNIKMRDMGGGTALELIGKQVVAIQQLPEGATEPKINEKHVERLKEQGLL